MLCGFESLLSKSKVGCEVLGVKMLLGERGVYSMLNRAYLKGLLRFDWGIKEKEFAV